MPRTGLHLGRSAHPARLSWFWLGMSLVSDSRMLNSNGNVAGTASFSTTQALSPIKIRLSPWKPLWGVEKLTAPLRAQATTWHHSSLTGQSQSGGRNIPYILDILKLLQRPSQDMWKASQWNGKILTPKDWQPEFDAETHGMWNEKTHSPKLSSDSVAHTMKHMSSQYTHNTIITTIIIF